jgi:hypothetical protein
MSFRTAPYVSAKSKLIPFPASNIAERDAVAASTAYSLTVQNNSSQGWNFYVYQQNPGTPNPNVFSLAWFVKGANPGSQVTFNWTIDYSFVWSETGQLVPGVTFTASQVLPADPTTDNLVTFTKNTFGYAFTNESAGGTPGSLTIVDDGSVPSLQASVGIGMSGNGTFVTQAQPNVSNIFTPTPTYWVSFGTSVQQGQVLAQTVGNSAQVVFAPNVYSTIMALNASNQWS